jgi:nucleotide-binding universal stress UspA family protein
MAKQFNTILIPVDFSANTDIAISKALSISQHNSCTIHLLHILQMGPVNLLEYAKYMFKGYSQREVLSVMGDSEDRLGYIKSSIESRRDDIVVYVDVCYGENIEATILKKATELGVDLVILGKRSAHSRFPRLNTVTPSRLAQQSGIPVLTVKPGSVDNDVKNVVMPIGSSFPASKLAVMEILQSIAAMQIMLVVFPYDEDAQAFSKQTLLNTFKTLKNQSANPVRYIILRGKNKAKALLGYCNEVGADMLIVNPGVETRMNHWLNSHISDFLPAGSKTSILAVRPR